MKLALLALALALASCADAALLEVSFERKAAHGGGGGGYANARAHVPPADCPPARPRSRPPHALPPASPLQLKNGTSLKDTLYQQATLKSLLATNTLSVATGHTFTVYTRNLGRYERAGERGRWQEVMVGGRSQGGSHSNTSFPSFPQQLARQLPLGRVRWRRCDRLRQRV